VKNIPREVNLELGMPTAGAAVRRLTYELHLSKSMGVTVLKIIHGYGSTGKGGRIRVEARRYLEEQVRKRFIKGFITGENFSIFDEDTRKAFLVCDGLRKDPDLERHNNGVSFVIL